MYSNFVHTCANGVGPSFVSDYYIKLVNKQSVLQKVHLLGCHRRMGDVWKPDAPIRKDILEVRFNILEERWEEGFGSRQRGYYLVWTVKL